MRLKGARVAWGERPGEVDCGALPACREVGEQTLVWAKGCEHTGGVQKEAGRENGPSSGKRGITRRAWYLWFSKSVKFADSPMKI